MASRVWLSNAARVGKKSGSGILEDSVGREVAYVEIDLHAIEEITSPGAVRYQPLGTANHLTTE